MALVLLILSVDFWPLLALPSTFLVIARLTVEAGGWLEDSSWLCRPGPRGASRKPGPCCWKWVDRCLVSPGLFVGGVGGGVGWCLLPLLFRVLSPEFSVGDVDARYIRPLLFALGLALRTSCLIRSSRGLSVGDVVRAAEVGVRRAPVLGAGVARGREQGYSPLIITLVMSPELSAGDVGKAAGGYVVLTPSI